MSWEINCQVCGRSSLDGLPDDANGDRCPACGQLPALILAGASASEPAQIMQVLDLLLDVAYHDGNDRDLAVAAEAYTLAGYHDSVISVSHADDVAERVAAARRGRPRRLLRHDAQGVLHAIRVLIREGVIDGAAGFRRTSERWEERGGHDRARGGVSPSAADEPGETP